MASGFPFLFMFGSPRLYGNFYGDPKSAGPMAANEVTAVMGSSISLMSLDTVAAVDDGYYS